MNIDWAEEVDCGEKADSLTRGRREGVSTKGDSREIYSKGNNICQSKKKRDDVLVRNVVVIRDLQTRSVSLSKCD